MPWFLVGPDPDSLILLGKRDAPMEAAVEYASTDAEVGDTIHVIEFEPFEVKLSRAFKTDITLSAINQDWPNELYQEAVRAMRERKELFAPLNAMIDVAEHDLNQQLGLHGQGKQVRKWAFVYLSDDPIVLEETNYPEGEQ